MTSLNSDRVPTQLMVAVLGNPCVYPEWTEDQLQALVDIGFNAVQLNIAWLYRPKDEALNLRDVVSLPGENEEVRVAERRAELRRRTELAKQFGLRTIFHFGSPFMWRNPYTGEIERRTCEDNDIMTSKDPWFDVLNPLVVDHETALLSEFRKSFPDVDDILVYTYDQDAWQVSEFRNSKFSRGIPLHERLPDYLHALHKVWTAGRADKATMWWEPWELSAGQIYKCIPKLPREGFGLMLHNNIAEAQVARPVDVWFRNTARMCRDLGIPVVGEGFFCSRTEEIEPLSIPCPRLVDEQFQAITGVSGVVGVKEYYGVLPTVQDFNLDMLRVRLANTGKSATELLEIITKRFGEAQEEVRRALGLLSDAMHIYPWDSSWFARSAGTASTDHGWSGGTVRGQMVETPSWRSTRCSHFMKTDDIQPHPFMLEDIQLRCEVCAENFSAAIGICRRLSESLPDGDDRNVFKQISEHADQLRRVVTSYALHLRETNVAQMLREDLDAGRPMMPRLIEEMERLLEADVQNQDNQGRVVEMEKRFKENPEQFVKTQMIPTNHTVLERGYHTMTTR